MKKFLWLLVVFICGFASAAFAGFVGPVQESGRLANFLAAVPDWVQVWALITAAASAIAAIAPTTRGDRLVSGMERVLYWLRKLVELAALDVLNAKPKGGDDADKIYDSGDYKNRS